MFYLLVLGHCVDERMTINNKLALECTGHIFVGRIVRPVFKYTNTCTMLHTQCIEQTGESQQVTNTLE